MFHIPPDPFELVRLNGESVSIAPPCSWSGLAPVQVRLLSYEWRDGQVGHDILNRTLKLDLLRAFTCASYCIIKLYSTSKLIEHNKNMGNIGYRNRNIQF